MLELKPKDIEVGDTIVIFSYDESSLNTEVTEYLVDKVNVGSRIGCVGIKHNGSTTGFPAVANLFSLRTFYIKRKCASSIQNLYSPSCTRIAEVVAKITTTSGTAKQSICNNCFNEIVEFTKDAESIYKDVSKL